MDGAMLVKSVTGNKQEYLVSDPRVSDYCNNDKIFSNSSMFLFFQILRNRKNFVIA